MDQIGFIEAAIERAAELAGLSQRRRPRRRVRAQEDPDRTNPQRDRSPAAGGMPETLNLRSLIEAVVTAGLLL